MDKVALRIAREVAADPFFQGRSYEEKMMGLAVGLAKVSAIKSGMDWNNLSNQQKEALSMMMYREVIKK